MEETCVQGVTVISRPVRVTQQNFVSKKNQNINKQIMSNSFDLLQINTSLQMFQILILQLSNNCNNRIFQVLSLSSGLRSNCQNKSQCGCILLLWTLVPPISSFYLFITYSLQIAQDVEDKRRHKTELIIETEANYFHKKLFYMEPLHY